MVPDRDRGQPRALREVSQSTTRTRTFVFTDIEGSTKLLRALGDGYADVLRAHDRIVRDAATACGGEAFGSEGDAQHLVFADAAAAVAAACRAQRDLAAHDWPEGHPVRVRMGIHSGDVRRDDDGFVGLVLHETARISSAAHGGQVLVSAATAELVRAGLPDDLSLRDLGEHRLKDMDEPWRLFLLDIDGLEPVLLPLRTQGGADVRLPQPPTSFVGREEVDAVVRLSQTARLLTLSGPGGTGKTRLSIAVAERIAPRFSDGTWFVALDAVSEAHLVASEIVTTLGLTTGSEPPLERLIEYLRERSVLLVLDNLEQVIDAGSDIARIIGETPAVTILVTSRIPLRIYGEQEFPVPAMLMPPRGLTDVDTIASFESVRLFEQRGRAARPSFAISADTAATIGAIVERLDGLPLAIELAAARIRMLSLDALLRRLDDRLATLSGGARDLPDRQRTLRGAIGWSHDLLDEPDRRLFARFGVIAGSATLAQVEAITGPGDEIGREVFDGLESLAEQSLVRVIAVDAEEPRFTMLATIREYARERLVESGESDAIHRRHAEAYLALAEALAPRLLGADGPACNDHLERDHDDLRGALEWIVANDEAELGLRMIVALWRFWQVRGHLHEADERVHAVLAMPSVAAQPPALRSRAEAAAGSVAYWSSQIPSMHRHYAKALTYAREAGDKALLAEALYNQGFAPSEVHLAQADRYREGRGYFEEARELYVQLGDRAGEASALWALSQSAMAVGDALEGDRLGTRSLEIARELDDPFRIGWAAFTVSLDRLSRDVDDDVSDLLGEALELFAAADDAGGVTLTLAAVAMFAHKRGREDASWRLLGAAHRLRDETGTDLLDEDVTFGYWDIHRFPETAAERRALGEGRALATDDAVDLAREVIGASEAPGWLDDA